MRLLQRPFFITCLPLAASLVLPATAQTIGSTGCAKQMDLGNLAGHSDLRASAMSAGGSVVVGSSKSPNGWLHAWVWTEAGGIIDPGSPLARARGVSADGTVVVGDQDGRPTRWTASGGLQYLGTTLPSSGGSAHDASADGSVIVGHEVNSSFPDGVLVHAFLWSAATGPMDLGPLYNHQFVNAACSISDDGSVVAGTRIVGQSVRAFRWTLSGGIEDLNPLGGAPDSFASAISGDGRVIVGSSGGRATRWIAPGVLEDLGTLGGGVSYARAVSHDGSVIVGDALTPSGRYHGFRWTRSGGMEDLGPFGGDNAFPSDVSADGTVLLVVADPTPGEMRVFRVRSSALGHTYCRPAVPNSAGCGGIVLASGDQRLASASLELTATLLPTFSFGYFLASRTQGFTAQPGGSQGNLCLDGSVGRFVGPGQIMNSGAEGSFALAVDLSAVPTPNGSVSVQAGETWHFQAWHRDSVAGSVTSNFTDAVSITFRQ